MINNPVPWPNGAKCAVCLTFDMDADSFLHLVHPTDAHKRIASLSSLRYGPEIAVPRILATYRRYGIKQTFFVPAWCIEAYPHAVEAMLADGHEIAHHGYIHEHPSELSRDEEHYLASARNRGDRKTHGRASARISRFRFTIFSDSSLDLLLEEGFLYDASLMGDDVPYLISNQRGKLVELPSHWALDDWPPYVHMSEIDYSMPIKAPEEAAKVFRSEFDAMWQCGGLWIAVWHPFVSGRLARWLEAERLIEYMMQKGDVWFARMDEVAAHVQAVIESGIHVPRIDRLPYYSGPVEIGPAQSPRATADYRGTA